MSTDPAPPGASTILGDAPATATMLDGTEVPLPPATPDQPAIGVLRQQAMGDLARLKGDMQFRDLLLKGDANALNEVKRLERIIKTPTGTFYQGVETPAQAEQHVAGWEYVGASLADVYGGELGAAIEAEQRAGGPISEAEHRQAKVLIERLKHDEEFQRKLRNGDTFCKARWSLAHRQVVRPIKMSPAW
jgi:hypothetical protein